MRPRLVEAAAIAGVLLLATATFAGILDAALNFDEAVYLASVDALLHGQELGADVFASQPPGWYLVLEAAARIAGNSVDAVRWSVLALSLAGCLAAYAAARAFGGHVAGLAAAAAVALAPPWPETAGRVEADPVAVALAVAALALAAVGLPGRLVVVALAGAALAAALSVKLLALPVLVPLVALAIARRAPARAYAAAFAGGLAVAVVVLVPHLDALAEIRAGAVDLHSEARAVPTIGPSNLERVLEFPHPRTPFAWIFAAGTVASLAALLTRRPLGLWPLWLFAAASTAFVLWTEPLHDHHLVLLAASWALPAATGLGILHGRTRGAARLALGAGLAVLLAGAFVQERDRLSAVEGERPEVLAAAEALAAGTGPGELVAADLPQVAYLARRRVPGPLIDASAVRVLSGSLAPAEIERWIADPRVGAAVIGREFGELPSVVAAARRRFPRRAEPDGVAVYLPGS